MEYRVLGRTGVKVAPLCFGSDNFADPTPEPECVRMLETAMDAGINLIDTGEVYAEGEGERIIGRALKANGRRHELLIATKVDHGRRVVGQSVVDYTGSIGPNEYGHSRINLIRACEGSLRRLQTDYIDLYQLHRPSPEMPFDETLRALDDLVRAGKIRYIGCSTHPAWMVAEAVMTSELKGYARFASEQPPYNLLDRRIENELIPMCQRLGLGIITWAPMAMGVLAGRYLSDSDYPEGSRAALRGGFYADRVTRAGIDDRPQVRRDRGRLRPHAGPVRDPLDQGSGRHHRAADRAAHPQAPGGSAAGARHDLDRRAAGRLRRAGAARQRRRRLPQHGGLDEDDGHAASRDSLVSRLRPGLTVGAPLRRRLPLAVGPRRRRTSCRPMSETGH